MTVNISVLVVASCFFSILSFIVALFAWLRAGQIPNMPKKMFQSIADVEGQVAVIDTKLKTHVKTEISGMGVAARKAKAAAVDPGASVAPGDYQELDRLLTGGGMPPPE